MKIISTRVAKQEPDSSAMEVCFDDPVRYGERTIITTLREGRDVLDGEFIDVAPELAHENLSVPQDLLMAVHEACSEDPNFIAEMDRICE